MRCARSSLGYYTWHVLLSCSDKLYENNEADYPECFSHRTCCRGRTSAAIHCSAHHCWSANLVRKLPRETIFFECLEHGSRNECDKAQFDRLSAVTLDGEWGGRRDLPWWRLLALSINSEGIDVAEWLAAKGITAFVLKYHLAHTGDDATEEFQQMWKDKERFGAILARTVPSRFRMDLKL